MSNDEPPPRRARKPLDRAPNPTIFWPLFIGHSLDIGHWSLVIPTLRFRQNLRTLLMVLCGRQLILFIGLQQLRQSLLLDAGNRQRHRLGSRWFAGFERGWNRFGFRSRWRRSNRRHDCQWRSDG